jgi:hypothetical protein
MPEIETRENDRDREERERERERERDDRDICRNAEETRRSRGRRVSVLSNVQTTSHYY